MGLTIHYEMEANTGSPKTVRRLVERCRQLALDLPFEQVGDIVDLKGKLCDTEARRAKLQNGGGSGLGPEGSQLRAGLALNDRWAGKAERISTWPHAL